MITVVSGLPRSGTSLMMQMLAAGGMPVLQDEDRPADVHNPRGYYEYRKVKSLERDNSWLVEAEGRVLKVVSLLLYHLPAGFEYRVVFLERNLDEVLSSQESMLSGTGQASGVERTVMRQHFERHLQSLGEWLARQNHIRRLTVRHSSLIATPENALREIVLFLERELDVAAMTRVVDRSLYRQRAAARPS